MSKGTNRIGRFAVAVLAGGVALVAGAGGVHSAADGVFRHTGYEAGVSIVEGAHTGTKDGLGTVTRVHRSGSQAGYALLRPKDPSWSGGGYRSEWHGDDHISGPGDERWHGISYYFPKDFNQGKNSRAFNDRIIFQFADQGSPMFSLHVDAGKKQLFLRRKKPEGGYQYLGRWSFQTERWYDIAFHVKWTKERTGIFEMYLDGDRVASYSGRTLAVRDVTYSKWGIYGQPTRLYFDEVRIATGPGQLEAVSP
ncbi:MAG: polysaccharide lyase [Dehalococcoidia bacterium]